MAAAGDTPNVPPLIPGLPDDISVRCIARLPLSFHPILSRVSKSWRSILRSPLLFTLRSDLSSIQPLLLLNLRIPSAHSPWFLLDASTHRIRLSPLPSPPLPTVGSSTAVLAPFLFLLGGSLNGIPSSAVQIFDARLRRWSAGPRMSTAREFVAAGTLHDVIYAVGGCVPVSNSWAERFDPLVWRWAPVPSPRGIRSKWTNVSAVLGGRLLVKGDRGGVAFDPTADRAWGPLTAKLDRGWRGRGAVVEGLLYSFGLVGNLRAYDWVTDEWRQVEGVEGLPRFSHGATMAGLGRLLCLVWEGKRGSREMEICFAGVEVSKMGDDRLWGKIVWAESVVLALPRGTMITHCVAMEL